MGQEAGITPSAHLVNSEKSYSKDRPYQKFHHRKKLRRPCCLCPSILKIPPVSPHSFTVLLFLILSAFRSRLNQMRCFVLRKEFRGWCRWWWGHWRWFHLYWCKFDSVLGNEYFGQLSFFLLVLPERRGDTHTTVVDTADSLGITGTSQQRRQYTS